VKTAKHDANGFFVPARTTAVFRRASQTSCAPYPLDMFVRGGFNNWADPPLAEYKLQFLGGTSYSVSAPISVPGDYEFKIADKDWGNTTGGLTDCGALNAGATVRLGVPSTLLCPSVGNNMKISTTIGGDYTFALEAADTSRPVLTVTKTPPTPLTLYVRGGFTDWGTSLPLVWDGAGTYRATAAIAAANVGSAQFFKIADADWGNTNNKATDCGGAVGSTPTVTLGTPFGLTCAADTPNLGITFPSAGSYLFAVNWANPAAPQLTVEKVPVEALFVRGAFNGWGQTDRLSYLGSGIYSLNKALAATAADFKVADADYNPVNCGGGTGGNTVTVGTTLPLACGANPPNLSLTPPTAGTYTFTVKINDASSGELTVTGP
jgi:pullulanase